MWGQISAMYLLANLIQLPRKWRWYCLLCGGMRTEMMIHNRHPINGRCYFHYLMGNDHFERDWSGGLQMGELGAVNLRILQEQMTCNQVPGPANAAHLAKQYSLLRMDKMMVSLTHTPPPRHTHTWRDEGKSVNTVLKCQVQVQNVSDTWDQYNSPVAFKKFPSLHVCLSLVAWPHW